MPECLQVASAGGAESIILSAGGAESMMLSACAESMDTLSTSAKSITLSAPPAESMILSAVLSCYYATLTGAATKKTTIGNTNDRRLRTAPQWQRRLVCHQGGQVLPHFQQIVVWALMPLRPIASVF
jgi:hypothetical protein